jgi:hypothetical protein
MSGAVAQLALFGQEDLVLSGNPEVTFFKLIFKRPSIFSMESIQQSFQGEADFGRRVISQITRSGDLVHHVFVEVDLPDLRDYSINTPISTQETGASIVSARWASNTTAIIRLLPSTDGLDAEYDVDIDGTVTRVADIDFSSSPIDIQLSGLDRNATQNPDVTVTRIDSGGSPGAASNTVQLSTLRWTNNIGHALIRHVDLEIGGARINRLTSEWMDTELELTTPADKITGLNEMLGRYNVWNLVTNSLEGPAKLYIPLTFSFCKTPGLALPLVALQFHNVQLAFDFRDYTELIKSDVPVTSLIDSGGRVPRCTIVPYVTFVYLGTNERRKFALGSSHEYLIEDIQFFGDTPIVFNGDEPNLQRRIAIDYSHPVSELIWTYNTSYSYNSALQPSMYSVNGNDYFNTNASSVSVEPVKSALVYINGNKRFSERSGSYFRLVQPYLHHTRTPEKRIYSYSFALNPEDPTPTGTLNFSRVDTAHLSVTFDDSFSNGTSNGRLRVYARSFNILKVANGMAGLLFASN